MVSKSDVPRIGVEETRKKQQEGDDLLLVCAYEDNEKFQNNHLDGAISFSDFQSRLPDLSRDHEIVFYCA